jgi:hypothetical protein
VIDIDDHPVVHQTGEQRLTLVGQTVGVAVGIDRSPIGEVRKQGMNNLEHEEKGLDPFRLVVVVEALGAVRESRTIPDIHEIAGDREVGEGPEVVVERRAGVLVVIEVDREDVTHPFAVVLLDLFLDVGFTAGAGGGLAAEEAVGLDTEHHRHVAFLDFLPRLGWGGHDAVPARARAV